MTDINSNRVSIHKKDNILSRDSILASRVTTVSTSTLLAHARVMLPVLLVPLATTTGKAALSSSCRPIHPSRFVMSVSSQVHKTVLSVAVSNVSWFSRL